MLKKLAAVLSLLPLAAIGLSAQGLDTRASKDDWEEINFEYNSSVLVDGFPSLLRLAELLQMNPGYKVLVEGHADRLGSNRFNDRLGMARANTVRDFLVKYGAGANQIQVVTRGKNDPKYPGQKGTYSRTDEARWMNRRVLLTVTDQQGRPVSAAGVGAAIRAIEPTPTLPADCCNEILRRLDRLDDIARMLKELTDQNAALQKEIDGLRQNQQSIESKVNQPPPPAPPPPPTSEEVASAVGKELDKRTKPRFELLNLNAGPDGNGNLTFTGKGRFFAPFGNGFAFQTEAEYYYVKGQEEGQFDFGLVDRIIPRLQAGLFSSFKHVNLAGNQTGGTLGQASLTLDYIFKYGMAGIYGTKGFMDSAMINSQAATINGVVSPDVLEQTYLRIVDQAGVSGSIALWGNNYTEANAGFLKSAMFGDRFGGTLRFIFPLNDKFALTAEGGINETLIGPGNDGRAVFGIQFGNVIRPKQYLGIDDAIPVDVPRVRYDVLTRSVRIGHTPPVASAGPNQLNVPAGVITLNGSGSYSPDGLPLTYVWTQQAGPAVVLSSPAAPSTTFTATAGQAYTFQLMVKDSLGGQAAAHTNVTTTSAKKAVIQSFIANPPNITAGQSSTLSWSVSGADTVTLSGIGNVALSGSRAVQPTQTTTYILTATAGGVSTTASATVTVGAQQISLSYCYATPTSISQGQSSAIHYQAVNATSVTISPPVGGTLGLVGTLAVTPSQSTTYTITAAGANGAGSVSCSVAVTVTAGQPPRILRFAANPASITAGQSSTLSWNVANGTTVSITTLNGVPLSGSRSVTPAATTTYTLTATNAQGTVTAQATVTVTTAAQQGAKPVVVFASGNSILTYTRYATLDASASYSAAGNNPLRFKWTARNNQAMIGSPASPTTTVQLPPAAVLGNYIFDVTVTDSKGNSTTAPITVEFMNPAP